MVALGRFELPTFGLGNRCSIHLSYRAMRLNLIISRQFTWTGTAEKASDAVALCAGKVAVVSPTFPFADILFEQLCHVLGKEA
jgi:hypothetical protein